MIVGVQFQSKWNDEFTGRVYSYLCDIPVAIGDIVAVPTASGESTAQICEINIPLERVPVHIRSVLKTVAKKVDAGEGKNGE